MADAPDLIPRRVLFGNPDRVQARISPDGTRLGWIAPVNDVLNVWVGPIDGGEGKPVTDDRDRGIRMFMWAHDNRHILYLQDRGGDENWRVYDVDLQTGVERDLTPFDEVAAQLVHADKNFPDQILLGLNKDNPQLHDIYRLDLPTGELTKIAENPGFVGWVADSEMRVRAGVAPTADGGMQMMVRDTEDGEWRLLATVEQGDALTTQPLAFDADGKGLLAISSIDHNAGRLVRFDTATGVAKAIAEDPQYDVAAVDLDPDTREPRIVVYAKDRVEVQVLDPAVKGDVRRLQDAFPGDLGFEGGDDADRTWLVAYNTDAGSVPYFAYDRDSGQVRHLFDARPELNKHDLAPMEPFSFKARDGLEVHGYITFPTGIERKGLPAVLNVHGGPWARDMWGYHPEAQWLSNRGYVCIQVNYRGSTGYGKDFLNAGDREWGGKMHDDLLDAVDYVVEQGWVDRKKVAIYGGSYGGYAALVGATFTPDVFACAVDIVGPSNLATLIHSIPPYWAPLIHQFHTRVADPDTEPDFTWERSPLSKVDNISIPLLIAQGANDPRVKQAESEQIVDAMKAKGIPHQYMLFPDEGHGFAKPENRMKFYAAAERFLAEHLGGRFEDED
jgi:dipeptidyl aminopeptidase/acylaminoacyl peptidase